MPAMPSLARSGWARQICAHSAMSASIASTSSTWRSPMAQCTHVGMTRRERSQPRAVISSASCSTENSSEVNATMEATGSPMTRSPGTARIPATVRSKARCIDAAAAMNPSWPLATRAAQAAAMQPPDLEPANEGEQ
eukprot:Amastigsp_a514539_140.p4 type:complete len:137 gc:universal Amastigsp_a514539_140:121-531(+)